MLGIRLQALPVDWTMQQALSVRSEERLRKGASAEPILPCQETLSMPLACLVRS